MMKVASSPSSSPQLGGQNRLVELSTKLSDEFVSELKANAAEEVERRNLVRSSQEQEQNVDIEEFGEYHEEKEEEEEEEDEEDEDEEFSFVSVNPDGSPITAEEAFQNGQIRPVFPLFNRDLLFDDESNLNGISGPDDNVQALRYPLKKLFVEERDGDGEGATATSSSEPQGPYCSWSGRTVEDASPETYEKSNSTGFSKLWRFRDLVLRSNSDGKDAFVFLSRNNNVKNHPNKSNEKADKDLHNQKEKRKVTAKTEKVKKEKGETVATAHERHYMRNRALRQEDKRKSYLPYKQVGIFTNVNGLSRNIHPF